MRGGGGQWSIRSGSTTGNVDLQREPGQGVSRVAHQEITTDKPRLAQEGCHLNYKLPGIECFQLSERSFFVSTVLCSHTKFLQVHLTPGTQTLEQVYSTIIITDFERFCTTEMKEPS